MSSFGSILVTGYSKVPKETSIYETYTYIGVALEVNTATHTIIDVDFTFVTDLPRDFFKRLLVGYNLQDGIEPLVNLIQKHFFARSQSAVIVSLQSAVQRYWDSIKQEQIFIG